MDLSRVHGKIFPACHNPKLRIGEGLNRPGYRVFAFESESINLFGSGEAPAFASVQCEDRPYFNSNNKANVNVYL